jgi:hypothetical protein
MRKRLSDIVTVGLGAALLLTLVWAKDRTSRPPPGVRTAIELAGSKAARRGFIDLAVMISSQSGTGKEPVSGAPQDYGKRRHSPFAALNMAAADRSRKGRVHWRAKNRTPGRFEQVEGGTRFLDEIVPLRRSFASLRKENTRPSAGFTSLTEPNFPASPQKTSAATGQKGARQARRAESSKGRRRRRSRNRS